MEEKEQFKELLKGIEKEIKELRENKGNFEDSNSRIVELEKEVNKIKEDLKN
jgi:predicted nuclease with TOPRIM domain